MEQIPGQVRQGLVESGGEFGHRGADFPVQGPVQERRGQQQIPREELLEGRVADPGLEGRPQEALNDDLHGQRAALSPSDGLAQAAEPLGIHGPEAAVEDGEVQGLLGAKMVGGRAEVDPGGLREQAHAHAVVAALAKQSFGDIQEPVGGVGGGLDFHGHTQFIHTYERGVKQKRFARSGSPAAGKRWAAQASSPKRLDPASTARASRVG